ncbi:MAG TPA: CDGSH iron-sulfur domain-containing protein [Casimicrobiaceae bacterium]
MSEATNVLTPRPNGPNVVSGDLVVATPARVQEMKTAVLCRCGHSSNKPFCDGTHVKIGFSDPAHLPSDAPTGIERAGRLTITPQPNGPNQCEGPLMIRDATGRTSVSDSTFLCRCGGSHTKPFCDGTHEKIGFKG